MLRNFTTIQVRRHIFCSSCQQQSKQKLNLARQSKVLGKLYGARIPGSKKLWYPTEDATNSNVAAGNNVTFHASQFGKSGSATGTGKHKNTRRMSVLNKLFMTHITDLLATGEASEAILGRGLQISHVKISTDFACINVYWLGTGAPLDDAALEKELQRCAGLLRHELSQLCLMGEVPRIKFVRDKTGSSINQVESILRNIDIPADETDNDFDSYKDSSTGYDIAQTVRQEFYDFKIKKTTPERSSTLDDDETLAQPKLDNAKSKSVVDTKATSNVLAMRHDVFGLDHRDIMSNILTKMKKSKHAWEQLNKQKNNSTNSSAAAEDMRIQHNKMVEAAKNEQKFEEFLVKQRREQKQTPERKKYKREEDLLAAVSAEENDCGSNEFQTQSTAEDYIDEEPHEQFK